jgi:hypothetical protein
LQAVRPAASPSRDSVRPIACPLTAAPSSGVSFSLGVYATSHLAPKRARSSRPAEARPDRAEANSAAARGPTPVVAAADGTAAAAAECPLAEAATVGLAAD